MPLFDEICKLAKKKDTETLTKKINEAKVSIHVQKGIYSPVILLAQQGEKEAVTFLISGYNEDRESAVSGYAMGGHTAQVDALLAQGVDRDWAVWGYAAGGHTAQVDALLAQGVNRDWAVWGYAAGGHTAQVDALLAQGANRDRAVWGYAAGGHTAQVDALLAQGSNRDRAVFLYAEGGHTAQVDALLAQGANQVHAVWGYKMGGYTANSERLLRVMTLTDNSSLRSALSEQASNPTSRDDLLKKSNRLRRLMEKNHLSYPWARAFTPALNFLFLQGGLLVKKGKIPFDLLLKISSYISGFSEANTHTFLSRHHVPQSNLLREGRHSFLFIRQASLIGDLAPSEKNFLLIPPEELTAEDKSLTLQKSTLRALLYEQYPKKRQTVLFHGACSKKLNLDSSTMIKQLKTLIENTLGDSIRLEDVRKAIHRTKIDFSDNAEKSGADFVLTQINKKFIDAAREQQTLRAKESEAKASRPG